MMASGVWCSVSQCVAVCCSVLQYVTLLNLHVALPVLQYVSSNMQICVFCSLKKKFSVLHVIHMNLLCRWPAALQNAGMSVLKKVIVSLIYRYIN